MNKINTEEYVRAHGKAPRGDGYWLFSAMPYPKGAMNAQAEYFKNLFRFNGSYGQASAAAKAHFAALGKREVHVCS